MHNRSNHIQKLKWRIITMIFLVIIGNTQVVGQSNVFFNITPIEGLPVSGLTDVTQDSEGFIWLGTWNGVYRYDGEHFQKMAPEGRYLEADDDGGIWIAAQTARVIYYNIYTERQKVYSKLNDRSRRYVDIEIDDENNVWLGTNKGLLQYDPEKDTFLKSEMIPEGIVYIPRYNSSGSMVCVNRVEDRYFITWIESDGNIRREPFSTENIKNGWTYQWPYHLQVFEDGSTILVNEKGIWEQPSRGADWIRVSIDNPEALSFSSSFLIKDNQLYVNKQDALAIVDLSSGVSRIFKSNYKDRNSILPMDSYRHGSEMFIDDQNVLWIPRFSHGLSRINLYGNDFGLMRDDNDEVIIDVLSGIELDDGSFYIGSREVGPSIFHISAEGRLLHKFGAHITSGQYPPGKSKGSLLSHEYPWAMIQTKDGSIWIGTGSPGPQNGGVNKWDPVSNEVTVFRHDPEDRASITNNWVVSLLEDNFGRLWVGSVNGISWIDLETEKVTRLNLSHQQGDDPDFSFVTMTKKDQLIFVDDDDARLTVVDLTDLEFEIKDLKLHDVLDRLNTYLHDDGKGRIWFNSEKGFGYINSDLEKVMQYWTFEEINFPATQVITINSEENGDIWFSTDNGLVEFYPESNQLKHYGIERGLQGNMYDSRLGYKSQSNKFLFAGNGGINVFDPSLIESNPTEPAMVLTNVLLDNVSIMDYDSIQLPVFARQNIMVGPEISTLNIEFNALHFASPGENNFQYKLEGYDPNWTSGKGLATATYTNLPHGTYSFLYRGSNLDGVWSDTHSLEIKILPPWWQTWWAYGIYLAVFLLLMWSLHRFQKNRTIRIEREKSKDRELAQAKEIEKAYTELKTTQAQLIHSEKMASLGELTAGIAHEIQNPLNFVNNFSEVSGELIDEAKVEMAEGETDEVNAILDDLKENLGKITHHGKRASGIVKSMLDHSRASSGEKVDTDINALCDEYLRLAYHGMRAKDRSFNAELVTTFDESLPKVQAVPQDIGRVLLNLINNAFQAVNEEPPKGKVSICTKNLGDQVEISVSDNGHGISDKVKDKIFQPFFTTKPTGEGTGLGLSLSYDIIKAHGGELSFESDKNIGTTFKIELPLTE